MDFLARMKASRWKTKASFFRVLWTTTRQCCAHWEKIFPSQMIFKKIPPRVLVDYLCSLADNQDWAATPHHQSHGREDSVSTCSPGLGCASVPCSPAFPSQADWAVVSQWDHNLNAISLSMLFVPQTTEGMNSEPGNGGSGLVFQSPSTKQNQQAFQGAYLAFSSTSLK